MSQTKALAPKKIGAPTKRNPLTEETLLKCVKRGVPIVHACAVVGINTQTLANWRAADPVLEQSIQRALAEGIDARLTKIEEASETDWRAAAWLLERCNYEHFGKSRIQVEAVGQFDHAFVIPRETLDEIAKARARQDSDQGSGNQPPSLPEPVIDLPAKRDNGEALLSGGSPEESGA